jgi:diacylglycerol kinase (ATP)
MLTALVALNIDVLANRNAGGLMRDQLEWDAILVGAAQRGARVHSTRTRDELARVARDIAARGTGAVVLVGGDGSTMAAISALEAAWPKGLPLPPLAMAGGGTVCTVARNFGARGPARSWAKRVVQAVCDGNAVTENKPTLRVRDSSGGDRVGFIFGAGLVSRFFEVYDSSPRRGLVAAAAITARVFVGSFAGSALSRRILDPAPCTLAIDGADQPGRAWSLVLASVVRDVGLHLLATYRAGEDPERFHVVASGLPARDLGPQMPRILAGRPLRGEPRVDTLARSLAVRFDDAAAAYVLDGDLVPARSATVEAGPSISLLVPS